MVATTAAPASTTVLTRTSLFSRYAEPAPMLSSSGSTWSGQSVNGSSTGGAP